MTLYNNTVIMSSLGMNFREHSLSTSGHCSVCVNYGVSSGTEFLQVLIYDYQSYCSLQESVCDLELRSRCCSLHKYRTITILSY